MAELSNAGQFPLLIMRIKDSMVVVVFWWRFPSARKGRVADPEILAVLQSGEQLTGPCLGQVQLFTKNKRVTIEYI